MRLLPAATFAPPAAALTLTLAACGGGGDTEASLIARQQALDPPQLWLVQSLTPQGEVDGQVFVCADRNLRQTFTRVRAEVNGQPCRDTTAAVIKPNGWALRCEIDKRPYAVTANTVGDLAHDFRLDFAVAELFYYPRPGGEPIAARQIRRFRHVGVCPAGWSIGDQAKPGRRPHKAT